MTLARMDLACSRTEGKARTGQVATGHGPLATPGALVYTRRGGPLNLTPDMLIKHQPAGVQVDVLQFLSNPGPDTLKAYGQGGHAYLAVPKTMPILASNRDPMMYEYGPKPTTDLGAYVTIHSGATVVLPDRYMSAVAALRPDLYVALSDEATHGTPPKKLSQSVTRTVKWLDMCLSLHAEHALDSVSGILAPVGGGCSTSERSRAAQAVADKPVAGFALCGFATGEAPGQERSALLAAAVQHLPPNKLRYMPGLMTPEEVLDGVAEGVDLFDGAYVIQASSGGYALTFPLRPGSPLPTEASDAVTGADDTKINLWSTAYRLDKSALVPGCSCYTCTKHTRAYVHHLLQTNEMLGDVLLEAHNTHHFHAFFAEVRAALQDGTFTQYHAWYKSLGLQQEVQLEPSSKGTKRGTSWSGHSFQEQAQSKRTAH